MLKVAAVGRVGEPPPPPPPLLQNTSICGADANPNAVGPLPFIPKEATVVAEGGEDDEEEEVDEKDEKDGVPEVAEEVFPIPTINPPPPPATAASALETGCCCCGDDEAKARS